MAIDERLAGHVRAALAGASEVREVRMFGGLGFMLNGNMVVCTSSRGGLLVRVGESAMAQAIARGAQPMVMNGRQMKGFVRVEGALNARSVKSWVGLARTFVDTLEPKARAAKPARRRRPS